MSTKLHLSNLIIAVFMAAGLVFTIRPVTPVRAVSTTLVISQFQVSGSSALDEFVEIHNVSGSSINLSGYKLVYRNESGTSDYLLVTFGAITLPAGGYYLAANSGYDEEGIPKDVSYLIGLAAAGAGIAIRDAQDQIVDSLGYGTVNNIFIEGTKTTAPSTNQSRARSGTGCTDTDNNANDFITINPSSPRNSSSPVFLCVPLDIAPAVISTFPSNGEDNVMPGNNISLEFSEPVTIIPESLFDIICDSVEQLATVSGNGTNFTIDPSADMPNDAICEVTVYAAAVVDQDEPLDHMAFDHEFSFTVAPVDDPPAVVNTVPDTDMTGVMVDTSISITFSEAVTLTPGFSDINCSSSGTHNIGLVDQTGDPVIIIDPDTTFTRGESCTVTIDATKVYDEDGTPTQMEANYVWNFSILPPDTAPAVTDVTPLNNATGIALTSDLSVIFSEPVNLESGWFTITCNRSGSHTGDVTGLEPGAEFSIDPADNFFNDDICTIIIIAAKVHDDDPVDPPDNLVSDYPWSFTTVGETTGLLIHDIQGGSHLSPLDGTTVTNVPGIVTALTLHGFYYQDPNPDSDDDTSEGMYVYTESAPVVNVGDYVYVSGTVDEYQSEGYTNDLHLTEIVNPGLIITRVTADNALPLPVVLGDGGREIPNKIIHTANEVDIEAGETFDQLTDAVDLYESLEGMRVQINSALAVAPTNSYGETAVVGDNGAHASKFSGRGGLVTATDDFNPERLLLDDLIMTYAPMLTGQASVAPVYGVMTYTYNNYKVEITEAIDFGTSVFTPEIADDQKDTELTIASFNILNLHPGDGSRYAALADQIVTNLGSPDIVVLEEVEDNNGTGTGVVAADVTITTLITAITAKGGPTYEYSQIDPVNNADGGEPDGNIRVAFLFDPNRVGFVNHGAGDATTATLPVLVGGEVMLSLSPGRVDPGNSAWLDSRKPLAGEFIFRGKRIIVVGCHLNSRSGDTPLFGFAQPPVLNSEIQRIAQADVLNSFVVSILAMDANAKVVVAGDMNDFPFSTPLAHLTGYGSNKVMTNLYDFLPANERYTYIYDGNSQALDNIFVTNNMLSMPGSTLFDIVHINTEDAYTSRVSDHDPILAYLNLGAYFFSLPIVAKAP